ncbi:MAG: hypothetical protein ACYCVZ_03110 [Streptosporangiaceae bacterium]
MPSAISTGHGLLGETLLGGITSAPGEDIATRDPLPEGRPLRRHVSARLTEVCGPRALGARSKRSMRWSK